MAAAVTREQTQADALKLELVRNSALAMELTGDQCVVHVILNRMAMQTSELTNYIFRVHGKY